MINVLVTENQVQVVSFKQAQELNWVNVENRNDWKNIDRATWIAEQLTKSTGRLHIATDAGQHVSPRYDVIEAPAVGDEVSYSFNGDTYPCGKIVSISKTLKRVVTDDGSIFYRRRNTGSWLNNGAWSMIRGHFTEQNPHI